MKTPRKTFNPDLLEDLARRQVVLFLGAGVTASAKQGTGGIRTWSAFLKDSAKSLSKQQRSEIKDLVDRGDYLTACELLKRYRDAEWEDAVRREFAKRAHPSKLHRELIKLDQRLIVTTNFDKLLEHAWNSHNRDETHFPKVECTLSDSCFRAFRDTENYLFKIHGDIDKPDSMIFTRSDYNEKAFANWTYTKFFETMLMTHTVLFVGCSLADPAVTFALEMHAQHHPKLRPHYAFLSGEYSETYLETMKTLRKLFIIPYSPAKNHGELTELVSDLVRKVEARRRELSAT